VGLHSTEKDFSVAFGSVAQCQDPRFIEPKTEAIKSMGLLNAGVSPLVRVLITHKLVVVKELMWHWHV
jgi:hypothetical protein